LKIKKSPLAPRIRPLSYWPTSPPKKSVTRYFFKCWFFSLRDAAFLKELDVFSRGRKFDVCEYLWISDWENPNPIFLGIEMWQAVTLDVKFTSLSPV